METTRKRRWWQFGLRDVLWLTVVVGLVIGWWIREHQLQSEFRREREGFMIRLVRQWEYIEGVKLFAASVGGFPIKGRDDADWTVTADGRIKCEFFGNYRTWHPPNGEGDSQ